MLRNVRRFRGKAGAGFDVSFLFIKVLFFVVVFVASAFLFYNQAFSTASPTKPAPFSSDLKSHIFFTERIFAGRMALPHPGFHTVCHWVSHWTGLSLGNLVIHDD